MALTRAQLAAENEALRNELATLRLQMQNMASVASAINRMPRPLSEVGLPVTEPWQAERAKAMAALKALALASR